MKFIQWIKDLKRITNKYILKQMREISWEV